MVYTNRVRHHKPAIARGLKSLALVALVLGATAPSASASTDDLSRVRSTDASILPLVREGMARSTTFRGLVEAIEQSNGIVYAEFGICAFGRLNGCLLPFLEGSHGDRYLRVVLSADARRCDHDQLLALIAHELRHALEVLDHPEIVNAAGMEALYRRIGTPETGGLMGYETSTARAAGSAVMSELTTPRPRSGQAIQLSSSKGVTP
jgi:hypothetical protein